MVRSHSIFMDHVAAPHQSKAMAVQIDRPYKEMLYPNWEPEAEVAVGCCGYPGVMLG